MNKFENDLIPDNLNRFCLENSTDKLTSTCKLFELSADDFRLRYPQAALLACAYGNLAIVRYLHEEIGLLAEDFLSDDNSHIKLACMNGHSDVVKYLHEKVGLPAKHFLDNENWNVRIAKSCGHLEIVDYFEEKFGVTPDRSTVEDCLRTVAVVVMFLWAAWCLVLFSRGLQSSN